MIFRKFWRFSTLPNVIHLRLVCFWSFLPDLVSLGVAKKRRASSIDLC